MLLTLNTVHVSIGLSHILHGVTLHVAPGEVGGLFGRNGVGKTTIVKTIAGWLAPSSGAISFNSTPIAGLASDRICHLGVGLVPEDRRVFPGLTVEENLRLGLMQVKREERTKAEEKLRGIYGRFPRLQERRYQLGTTLSGGEQQILSIARTLVGSPKLILIDEPTEGLAPMVVRDIFQTIHTLRSQGIAVLLIEQNVHNALTVCDRFYAIERGEVVLEGRAKDEEAVRALIQTISV
ncbi:MAG: ABC transporter ATP-binding protein [Burkholderiaceae bacterium]